MPTLEELSYHLKDVSEDTSDDEILGEVFAAWIKTDAELSLEGKTDYAARRTPTAWCWSDWVRLQSLGLRFSEWSGCRNCLGGEVIGKRTIHHLIECRNARPPGIWNLRERTDAMDRDIASITKVRGWMPRSGLHLGYDPSTDPPRTTLEYKGIKRMQRGKRGDQISHGDTIPAAQKAIRVSWRGVTV
jgi:hypothetical protein